MRLVVALGIEPLNLVQDVEASLHVGSVIYTGSILHAGTTKNVDGAQNCYSSGSPRLIPAKSVHPCWQARCSIRVLSQPNSGWICSAAVLSVVVGTLISGCGGEAAVTPIAPASVPSTTSDVPASPTASTPSQTPTATIAVTRSGAAGTAITCAAGDKHRQVVG